MSIKTLSNAADSVNYLSVSTLNITKKAKKDVLKNVRLYVQNGIFHFIAYAVLEQDLSCSKERLIVRNIWKVEEVRIQPVPYG